MKKIKDTRNAFSKGFALVIPAIVSVCTFIFVFAKTTFRKNYIETLSHLIATNNIRIETISKQLYQLIEDDKNNSLELVVGIIGVAVSVWIGLSIYNSIEKREVEKTLDSIDSILKEIERKHRALYLTTMLKSRAEDSFAQQYIERIQSRLPSLSLKTIDTIIEMETLLSNYDGVFSSSENEVAKEELEKIRTECGLLRHKLNKSSEDEILLSYYHYKLGGVYCRIADNLFRNKERKELSESYFYNAISEYKKAGELDPAFLSVDNGIGFSYLRLSQLNNNDQEKGTLAIKYLILACETNPRFQKAIRNLGVAYEVCNELDKAIEQYKKAEMLFPDSYLVHSCLASAYLKKIDAKIDFLGRSHLFDKQYCLFNSEEKEEVLFYLKQAKWHADYVVRLTPGKIDGYYRLIEYYTFLILTTKSQNEIYNKYSKEIDELIQYCQMIDTSNNAYRCHLRNYYEVVGDLNQARKINDTLLSGKKNIY